MSIALQARGLSIGYRNKGEPERAIASGLDLALEAGRFACLLGPNGVGKSTLIRVLAGMQKPLAGSVRLAGRALEEMSPKEKARAVSVVLTDALPVGLFTARSLVALGRHPHTNWAGSLGERDRERIGWAMRAVDADTLADRQIAELSDGERQKVMIARALAQEAKVMLLDEPTAYLDLPRRVDLMRTLRDLARREGLSILLSTHDLDLALRCADELWLFGQDGRVTTGIPEELALDGSLAATFRSDELDWDNELGSFRMHREPCDLVFLEGSGPAAIWTGRALMRLGFGLAETPAESKFSIRIEGASWIVSSEEARHRFERLSELVAWIGDPARYGRPHEREISG